MTPNPEVLVLLLFVLALSISLGLELISKVPSTLHTPLMSGANAISGVTLVGALVAAGEGADPLSAWMGAGAVALAAINVFGGYLVTARMLGMFRSGDKSARGQSARGQSARGQQGAGSQNRGEKGGE